MEGILYKVVKSICENPNSVGAGLIPKECEHLVSEMRCCAIIFNATTVDDSTFAELTPYYKDTYAALYSKNWLIRFIQRQIKADNLAHIKRMNARLEKLSASMQTKKPIN